VNNLNEIPCADLPLELVKQMLLFCMQPTLGFCHFLFKNLRWIFWHPTFKNIIRSFGTFKASIVYIMVFYFEISCRPVNGYRRFEGTCYLHLQDWILFLGRSVFPRYSIPHLWWKISFSLKMAVFLPITSLVLIGLISLLLSFLDTCQHNRTNSRTYTYQLSSWKKHARLKRPYLSTWLHEVTARNTAS
jgi:hypothetical protein